MSIIDDTAQLLLNTRLNITVNQMFGGVEADDEVDPAITIVTYTNEPSLTTHDRVRPAIEIPRVELTFRSRDVQEAMRLAEAVYGALLQPGGQVLNGMQYVNFWPLDPPVQQPGPPDSNGRYGITLRLRARRKP